MRYPSTSVHDYYASNNSSSYCGSNNSSSYYGSNNRSSCSHDYCWWRDHDSCGHLNVSYNASNDHLGHLNLDLDLDLDDDDDDSFVRLWGERAGGRIV